jgi:hypothetical protein
MGNLFDAPGAAGGGVCRGVSGLHLDGGRWGGDTGVSDDIRSGIGAQLIQSVLCTNVIHPCSHGHEHAWVSDGFATTPTEIAYSRR